MMGMSRLIPRALRRLALCQEGGVILIFALMLPVLLAGLALAMETGTWFATQRKLQHAADAATYSAAVAMVSGDDVAAITATARRVALSSGLRADTGQVRVTFPAEDQVEVVLTDQRPYLILRALDAVTEGPDRFGGAIGLSARAVATVSALEEVELPVCIQVLNPTGTTMTMGGNAALAIPTCTVEVASTGTPALSLGGTARIDAACVTAAGSIAGTGGITTTQCNTPRPNRAPAPLFAQLQTLPTPSAPRSVPAVGLANNERTVLATHTAHPSGVAMRRFQGGLSLNGNTTYEFGPGLFIIDGGVFRTRNRTVLIATQGTTFYLMNGAYIDFHSGTTSRLSGMTSGPWANIVLFDSNDATSMQSHTLVTSELDGIVYLPRATFQLGGGAGVGNGCFIIAIGSFALAGGSSISAECDITSVDLTGYWGDNPEQAIDIRLIE